MISAPARCPRLARVELSRPVFLSDVHVTSVRPETRTRLLDSLAAIARGEPGGELVILGDLFEFWAGDDTLEGDEPDDHLAREVADSLATVAASGTRVYLMHGNRDCLLGEAFLARSGALLLADPTVALVPGGQVLLSHGDAWCTLDVAYQAFRVQARDPAFQTAFLSLPIAVRKARIGQARVQSEAGKRHMREDIMDVTPEAVEEAMRASGTQRVIHGHTHRPARHDFQVAGAPATRWVLSDWADDPGQPARGGLLAWDAGGLRPA